MIYWRYKKVPPTKPTMNPIAKTEIISFSQLSVSKAPPLRKQTPSAR
ncbi:hypothetical protein [Methanobrevibacter arboriphilus]|nr:hypothetical protein [Methanobrevibacter arboriphilus]